MKRSKLTLKTQTILRLSTAQLGKVGGAIGSRQGTLCSTMEDTGCYPSANYLCDTSAGEATCACGTQQMCPSQAGC